MNKSLILLTAATLAFAAPKALAETAQATASVTVQNAFNLTPGDPLNFGTIFALADTTGTAVATLVLPANGSAASATPASPANIIVISSGTPATFTITGAAPLTNLTLTLPTAPITLQGSNTATFTVDNFNALVTTGGNSTAYTSGSPNLATDSSGEGSFAVGATLNTTNVASYSDETYSGTFSVEVAY